MFSPVFTPGPRTIAFFLRIFSAASFTIFVIDNSRAKLAKKNLDMVAANNVKVEGAGFQGDTNVLTLITQDEEISLPLMSKEDAAFRILDKILSMMMQDFVC